MLYYNRIDVSEDADVNMSGAYKKCIICHYGSGFEQLSVYWD